MNPATPAQRARLRQIQQYPGEVFASTNRFTLKWKGRALMGGLTYVMQDSLEEAGFILCGEPQTILAYGRVQRIWLSPEGLAHAGGLPSDEQLRVWWRAAEGSFFGPNIETGSMPESNLLPFLRRLWSIA